MTTQVVETGLNVNKPVQLPAWVLIILLGGGGSWLTWHEFTANEPAAAAPPVHHDCADAVKADVSALKADVAALKVQMDQMDARLARIEDALINGKR